jgi:predicted DNA-binding transcriptional regulator AlpA
MAATAKGLSDEKAGRAVKLPVSRPPSFLSRKELAWELSVSESTVDELVRRGVFPPATRLTPGTVRWSWAAVEAALASLTPTTEDADPYMTGARNAIKDARGGPKNDGRARQ